MLNTQVHRNTLHNIFYLIVLCLLLNLYLVPNVRAESVTVAVASNALSAAKYLADEFAIKTGYNIRVSSGSTGKLYSQIVNGAPYDIYMAANEREPLRLEKNDHIVKGTRSTYALGQLVLLSSDNSLKLEKGLEVYLGMIAEGKLNRLSIANPRIAPYGLAAKQVMENLELWEKVQANLIRGENINQAFQYVLSGNVPLGIVALSQVKQRTYNANQYIVIPKELHNPIKQQVVLLKRAESNVAAKAFLDYLMSNEVGHILQTRYGYGRSALEGT